jgi:hypothetical protein
MEAALAISQKRVRNIDNYIPRALQNSDVRVVIGLESLSDRAWERLGLDKSAAAGTKFLPPIIGPITRFNAEGRWRIRRDLPKEPRYIRTVWWRWTQWRGRDSEEHEDSRDIFRDCYPRELVAPPAEELTVIELEGHKFLASDAAQLPKEKERLTHQVNLLLEIAGACEIVDAKSLRAPPKITRRNWKFLPPGKHPWDRVKEALEPFRGRMSEGDAKILEVRQQIVSELGPTEIAAGEGGFADYLAYIFPDKDAVVLESIRRDNAIYVFGGDWEHFSRLTKAEVLRSGVHKERIIHSTGWPEKLRQALKG